MASEKSFHVSVVTPEEPVLDCDARFVAFPSHDGQVGVLAHRAPFLHRMGAGSLRVDAADGTSQVFFVAGGFAQMVDDRLTLLTEQAIPGDSIDRDQAEAALADAVAMPATDEASQDLRQRAIDSARARIRMAG